MANRYKGKLSALGQISRERNDGQYWPEVPATNYSSSIHSSHDNTFYLKEDLCSKVSDAVDM